MKLNESDKNIGHAFGYFGKYSVCGLYLNEVNYGDEDKGIEPHYDELWIEIDQAYCQGTVYTAIEDKIFIDIFQSKPLCDLFLIYLSAYMNEKHIDEEYRNQINDWYFSDNPKFKIFYS